MQRSRTVSTAMATARVAFRMFNVKDYTSTLELGSSEKSWSRSEDIKRDKKYLPN